MGIHVDEQVEFEAYLLSHIADAAVAIDRQQRITYWNRGAEQLYGVIADAVLGHPLTELGEVVWLSSMEAQEELAHTGRWCGEHGPCLDQPVVLGCRAGGARAGCG